MGKVDWRIKKPDWISQEELVSTDLRRRHIFKKNHPKRAGALQELCPPEELGMPVNEERLVEVIIENEFLKNKSLAERRVAEVIKNTKEVLTKVGKDKSPLDLDVIISCLVDCMKSERKLSRKEIDARKYFRKKKIYKNTDKYRHTKYRDELLVLLEGMGFGKIEASEYIAKWLTLLGSNVGDKVITGSCQPDSFFYSETQHGTQVASAAATIRKALGNKRRASKVLK